MESEPFSCDTAQDIMSARLDHEATAAEERMLDAHLPGCADCTRALQRVERLDRQLRVRVAEPVPDLRQAILSRARPASLGHAGWRRPALGWVGVLLVAQNAVALFAGELNGVETHLARHLGAFGVALGIGLLLVAVRPSRAYGILPFVSALIVTMLAGAAFDVVENGRNAAAEATHLTEIAGLVLVWMIAGSPGWSGLVDSIRHRLAMMRSGRAQA